MNNHLLRRVRPAKTFLALAIALGLLATGATVAFMVSLSQVVERVFLDGESLAGVSASLTLLLFAVVLRAALAWGREVAARRGAIHTKRTLRGMLTSHLLKLGPAYSGAERVGELTTTISEGVEKLDAYFARYVPQVMLAVLAPLLVAACVFAFDPLSGFVLLATGPAIPVLMVLIGKHAEAHTRDQWQALSRMGAHFLDVLRGLPTLKAFGRSADERGRIEEISGEFGRRTMEVLRVAFVSGLALEFIATVSVGLIAVLLGVRMLFGDLPLGAAFPVLLLAPEFYRPLRDLGSSRHAGMEGKAAAERIAEILDTPPPVSEPEAPEEAPDTPISIELRDVSFAYPDTDDRPALSGVNLTLRAGTRTALVGPSGAGKSTLASLLTRFIEAGAGEVLANGVPITDFATGDWREKVALVGQSPRLFFGSVMDNLLIARPGATREDVERAANLAGAHEFIRRLPNGYDTHIGERGARLSEGEARRIAIARAFLKDAPILVMDEPASSLDPESERGIHAALENLAEGRTTLIIAHRLGTARAADNVAVLEDGRVAQTGSHAELVGAGGAYDRLVKSTKSAKPASRNTVGENIGFREVGERGYAKREYGDTPEETGGGVEIPNRRVFGRLLGFLSDDRRRVALSAALAVWTAGSNVGLLAVSAYLISAAALAPPLSTLIPAAVLAQVLGASRGFTRYAERLVSHDVTFGLLARLRVWLYERLEPLSPAHLTHRRGGDLLSRMVDDVEELQNAYLGAISPAVVAASVSALSCAFLYAFAPSAALAAFVLLLLAGVGAPLFVAALERGLGGERVRLRADLDSELAEWLWGLEDLFAFGRAGERQRKILDLADRVGREQRRTAFATGLRESLHELLAGLAAWTALVLAAPLVGGGEIGGVYLALIALVALASFDAVCPLGEAAQSLGDSLAAGRRLFEISDEKPAVSDPENPLPIPLGKVEFDRVTFHYERGEPAALEDVSFALPVGGKIAVVGSSGSGKSTLANLLLRFWDADEGEILLGGNDIREYAQEGVRSVFSVAAQDAHLFDATLRENLLLAAPDAEERDLWSALKEAGLGAFVGGLPDGLDTRVGELGGRLSGGERRRLVVARAFLKDAPFLVLDEPTADLDANNERALIDAIHERAEGRGLLLITHRLVGMERMDGILVLEAGRIVERGRHEDLMNKNGAYKRMVEIQNSMLGSG